MDGGFAFMNVRTLFKNRQYASLFYAQFLGALNDNFFKNALMMIFAFQNITLWNIEAKNLVALGGGIFILPFFIFSALAGQLADKYERSRIVVLTKGLEVMIMVAAALGLYLQSYGFLLFVLFLMGTQSTFFGPLKYSLLPDILEESQLVAGNAYIELGTFLAILVGTVAGGVLVESPSGIAWLMAGLIFLAVLGFLASLRLKPFPLADRGLKIDKNLFTPTLQLLRESQNNPAVFNSILGVSWFWGFGAAFLSIIPVYGQDFIRGEPLIITIFLATFTIGIGIGSIVCERLSQDQIELGLVPIGSLGMSFFLIDLFFVPNPNFMVSAEASLLTLGEFVRSWQGRRILIDFLLLAIFGGFFTVPLYSLIQQRSEPEKRSRIIAANNILNAVFMVLAALALMGLYAAQLTIPQIFMVIALCNIAVAVYIYSLVPEFTLRLYSWVLVHVLYRIELKGLHHIPKSGPVVLACNHVSFVDWLIIAGCLRRPTHFVIYYKFFEIPVLKWLLKQAGVIPIAGQKEDPQILTSAFSQISQCLADGNVVCIFPEGMITRNGRMNPLRPGILKILEQSPVPVVPLGLKGLWGSLFSHKDAPALRKLPRRFWHRVQLNIGRPIPADEFSLESLQNAIAELSQSAGP